MPQLVAAAEPFASQFLSTKRYLPFFEVGATKLFNSSSRAAGTYDLCLPLWQTNHQLVFSDLRVFDRTGS